jgi:hypothetical protein
MLVDNKSLVFQLSEYIRDIDAYMMGHHEVEFKRIIGNLPFHKNLCANVIAQSVSDSPLSYYEIKYVDNGKWVTWIPFLSKYSFSQLITLSKVDVMLNEKNIASRKLYLQTSCMNWCRRLIFRSVDSVDRVRLVANA